MHNNTNLPTTGEYWILEILIFSTRLVQQIHPDIIVRETLTIGPDFTWEELCHALQNLYLQGYINFSRDNQHEAETASQVKVTFDDMLALNDKRANIWCQLTEAGGQLWEQLSNPDWQRFIAGEFLLTNEVKIYSANRVLLEQYFQSPDVQSKIVDGSLRWDRESPGQIMFWKILPEVFSITFLPLSPDAGWDLPQFSLLDRDAEWNVSVQYHPWYHSPFTPVK